MIHTVKERKKGGSGVSNGQVQEFTSFCHSHNISLNAPEKNFYSYHHSKEKHRVWSNTLNQVFYDTYPDFADLLEQNLKAADRMTKDQILDKFDKRSRLKLHTLTAYEFKEP